MYGFLPEAFILLSLILLLLFFTYYTTKQVGKYYLNLTTIIFYLLMLWNLLELWLVMNSADDVIKGGFLQLTMSSFLTVNIKAIILILYIFVLIYSYYYCKINNIQMFEFSYLITTSLSGLLIMIESTNFLGVYLGLELFNLSLYCVISLKRDSIYNIEASIKYLIFGGLSSGLLLFGISLIYNFTGSINFLDLNIFFWNEINFEVLVYVAVLLIIFAFAIKLASAPFHLWAIDVYEGSPYLITFYLMLIPKIAFFIVFIKIFFVAFIALFTFWKVIFLILIFSSAFIGTFGAIYSTKIKKILIYSMISNISFFLIPFVTGSVINLSLLIYFFIIYSLNLIGLFYFFGCLIDWSTNKYLKDLSSLVNLSSANKILALSLVIFLASMGGLPPLAGFFPKFYLFIELYLHGYYFLFFYLLVLNSIGLFYYIRLIKLMFFYKNKNFILLKPIPLYISYIISFFFFFNIIFIFFAEEILDYCIIVITTILW